MLTNGDVNICHKRWFNSATCAKSGDCYKDKKWLECFYVMKQRSSSRILRFYICLNVFFKLLGKKRIFNSNSWLSAAAFHLQSPRQSQNSNFNKELCLNSVFSLAGLLVERKINLQTGILLHLKTEVCSVRSKKPQGEGMTTRHKAPSWGSSHRKTVDRINGKRSKTAGLWEFSENKRENPHPPKANPYLSRQIKPSE